MHFDCKWNRNGFFCSHQYLVISFGYTKNKIKNKTIHTIWHHVEISRSNNCDQLAIQLFSPSQPRNNWDNVPISTILDTISSWKIIRVFLLCCVSHTEYARMQTNNLPGTTTTGIASISIIINECQVHQTDHFQIHVASPLIVDLEKNQTVSTNYSSQ